MTRYIRSTLDHAEIFIAGTNDSTIPSCHVQDAFKIDSRYQRVSSYYSLLFTIYRKKKKEKKINNDRHDLVAQSEKLIDD